MVHTYFCLFLLLFFSNLTHSQIGVQMIESESYVVCYKQNTTEYFLSSTASEDKVAGEFDLTGSMDEEFSRPNLIVQNDSLSSGYVVNPIVKENQDNNTSSEVTVQQHTVNFDSKNGIDYPHFSSTFSLSENFNEEVPSFLQEDLELSYKVENDRGRATCCMAQGYRGTFVGWKFYCTTKIGECDEIYLDEDCLKFPVTVGTVYSLLAVGPKGERVGWGPFLIYEREYKTEISPKAINR